MQTATLQQMELNQVAQRFGVFLKFFLAILCLAGAANLVQAQNPTTPMLPAVMPKMDCGQLATVLSAIPWVAISIRG